MPRVFIDGSAGTTGLRIADRLQSRTDIELLTIDADRRKDRDARKELLNDADIVFLCLPDAAAQEAAAMIANGTTAVIDTSTAHRVAPGWVYGFPELSGQRDKIRRSRRIANPGCHASGFIALTAPLVELGVLRKDAKLTCFSLTGFSGGGKAMIADYESTTDPLLSAPRMYGLAQTHKHLPEMQKLCGLETPPVFCPVVAPYYAGMEVTVPLFGADCTAARQEIEDLYRSYYRTGLVFVASADEGGFLSAAALAGKDTMQIGVFGNDSRMTLVARFDNLGKGASGAAIQNMNLLLGVEESAGLIV